MRGEPEPKGENMTTTSLSKATRTDRGSRRSTRRIALGGAAGGIAAIAAVEVYAAIGRAAGIPMRAGAPGAQTALPVTAGSFAIGILICTFWGTVLAVVVAKVARRPARAFTAIAILLTAASLVSPLAAGHAAYSTRLFLAGAHVLSATIIIPTLARCVNGMLDGDMSGNSTPSARTRTGSAAEDLYDHDHGSVDAGSGGSDGEASRGRSARL